MGNVSHRSTRSGNVQTLEISLDAEALLSLVQARPQKDLDRLLKQYLKAEKAVLKKLTSTDDHTGEDCVICIQPMELDQDTLVLPCRHIFHSACCLKMTTHMLAENKIPACPCCRSEFYVDVELIRALS